MNPVGTSTNKTALNDLPDTLIPGQPWSALAPMQDVTNLPFMQLLGKYGPPDLLFTEFFRVHGHSALDQPMIDSICEHGTGRPVFIQLIGASDQVEMIFHDYVPKYVSAALVVHEAH